MKTLKALLMILAVLMVLPLSAQKKIQLEDIWTKGEFSQQSVRGIRSMQDGEHFTKLSMRRNAILKVDYQTGSREETLFSLDDFDKTFKRDWIYDYKFSKDEKQILIATGYESIYRHSYKANFYLYDMEDKSIKPIREDDKIQLAAFAPTGTNVSYVFENNIYLYDIHTGQTIAVTEDGKENKIINGAPDWVYEEEFSFAKAYEWSADSKYIAFLKTDESNVKEYNMPIYGELYPEDYTYKYPKAGEKNSEVSLHVYDAVSGREKRIEMEAQGEHYIPRIYQTPQPGVFAVVTLNRLQNDYRIHKIDANEKSADLVVHLKEEKYFELYDDLTFLPDGNSFVMTHEGSGYRHLYRYSIDGDEKGQITHGSWDVTDFYGYDEKEGLYYYQSAEESPTQRDVYSISQDGDVRRKLNSKSGTTAFRFSEGFTYYIEEHSDANTPLTVNLYNKDSELVRVLEENNDLKESMEEFGFADKEFFTVKGKDGTDLNAWMIKPADFNKRNEYPVLMYTYGGPGAQTVNDAWDYNMGWWQLLAQQGYIIVSVDNRGTGARGKDFRQVTYGQLGKFETMDQVAAAKSLASRKYIDENRIGIFGWSYGGYLTNLCLTTGGGVFSAGIAVAPVTNWRYYDTIYTERYNGLPKDNEEGYDENSPINHAEKLEGKLLLVHGSADDNVHFQNSMDFINKLIAANKQFDLMAYPNRAHGINGGGARLHLYTGMTDFLLENL
ncbi:MAG: S9 family peptidase [Bacteroidales bacterium]